MDNQESPLWNKLPTASQVRAVGSEWQKLLKGDTTFVLQEPPKTDLDWGHLAENGAPLPKLAPQKRGQ